MCFVQPEGPGLDGLLVFPVCGLHLKQVPKQQQIVKSMSVINVVVHLNLLINCFVYCIIFFFSLIKMNYCVCARELVFGLWEHRTAFHQKHVLRDHLFCSQCHHS